MKLFCRNAIVISLMALCAGCLVLGKNKEYQPFDAAEVNQLVPGKTKAGEVTELFGAPSEVVKLANGNAYIYRRVLTKGTALWLVLITLGNADKQYDQLVFFFDLNDRLTHYGVSQHAQKSSYGLPF